MAVAVALPVFDVVAMVVVVEARRKSLSIVLANVRIALYGVAIRQG